MLTIQFDRSNRQSTAPAFRLPTASGDWIALDDFYEKGSLVVIFIPENPSPSDLDPVKEIDDQLDRIECENAHIIGISPQPFAELLTDRHPSFPILVDEDGRLRGSYTDLVEPGLAREANILVYILDSYGAPYICLVGPEPGETIVDELLSWLLFISIQCPE